MADQRPDSPPPPFDDTVNLANQPPSAMSSGDEKKPLAPPSLPARVQTPDLPPRGSGSTSAVGGGSSGSNLPIPPPPRRLRPVTTPKPESSSTTTTAAPLTSHAAPPRRANIPRPIVGEAIPTATPEKESWKAWSKRKGGAWGSTAVEKSITISDKVGARVNGWSVGMGAEAFWPTTGDFPAEMDKAARILKMFTETGIEAKAEVIDGKGKKKQTKILKKIPAKVIREAKGLAIFTSMRTGIAPFAGAGGAGVVVAKLEDGTWSAPASMSPNNLSAGFMLGVDIYNAILIIRTQKALDSFSTHKATLGTEIGVAAGPYGSGAALELGKEKSPVLSYVSSKGFFAGVEVVGQVFVERFDENAAMYSWPGIKAGDILTGKVRVPIEAASLQQALHDAESGEAQRKHGDLNEFDEVPDISTLQLEEGEVLHMPPTPRQLSAEDEVENQVLINKLREEERERKRKVEEEQHWAAHEKAVEERERKEQEENLARERLEAEKMVDVKI